MTDASPAPTDTPTPAPTPTTPASDAPAAVPAGDEAAASPAPAQGDDDATLVGGAKARDGDATPAEGDAPADGESDLPEAVVPEAYDLKIVAKDDDGAETTVELDAALVEEATPLFKEAGLTNEAANKLAPLALKVQERMLQQISDEHSARIADWAKQVKADPELGGMKWGVTESNIDRALTTFGAPSVKDEAGNETNEFRALLNESGLGNHPVIARMFSNIGKALGEDNTLVRTDAIATTKKSPEAELYPNDVPKK